MGTRGNVRRWAAVFGMVTFGWAGCAGGAGEAPAGSASRPGRPGVPGFAAITEGRGSVSVTTAAGARREVAMPPASPVPLGPGDEVATGPEAAVAVVLADGTRIDARASSRVSVVETPIPPAEQRRNKTVRRRIRMPAGDASFDITPGTATMTEIETPAGIAESWD